jgi:hypothetical protein
MTAGLPGIKSNLSVELLLRRLNGFLCNNFCVSRCGFACQQGVEQEWLRIETLRGSRLQGCYRFH